jgi:large subunit ribosomal protein L28
MSFQCDLCAKGAMHGKNVSHSHLKTRKTFLPNIQKVTVKLNDKEQKLKLCTRCLRSLYKEPK